MYSILIAAVLLLLTVAIAVRLIVKWVTALLARLAQYVDALAAGDFTEETARRYLGDRADISDIVRRTRTGGNEAERVTATVLAMRATMRSLLGGMHRSAEQLAGAAAQLQETTGQTARSAQDVAQIAAGAQAQVGRGFAVVAQEVRSLAGRAGKSAGEIAAILQATQAATAAAVQAMQDGTAEVEQGAALAGEAGRALAEILAATGQTSRAI